MPHLLEDLFELYARVDRHQLKSVATNPDGYQGDDDVQDNAFGFGVENQEPTHNIEIDGVTFGVFLKKRKKQLVIYHLDLYQPCYR